METFYKAEVPPDEWSRHEYYQLKVTPADSDLWELQVYHGWWDDEGKRPVGKFVVLDNSKDPVPQGEVWRLYGQQRACILGQGFRHIYERDFITGGYIHHHVKP